MAVFDEAKSVFETFRQAFEAEPCDLPKCQELLAKLKLIIFSGFRSSVALKDVGEDAEVAKERLLTREALELACFLSVRLRDMAGFERHVAQLKMYYNSSPGEGLKPSERQYPIMGLYLLHLLAGNRIGEFHTELELIPVDEHENNFIKQPVQLERHLMEGNYAKILEAQKDVPKTYYPFFMERLVETVRLKVGASMERSYTDLPVDEAAKMLILGNIGELQEFASKENERKAREQLDDPMGDATPSITRRVPLIGTIRWEVRDGRLHFIRTQEKQLEIPALDLMVNTIGYATDLERIV